jgi:hypothetical protein
MRKAAISSALSVLMLAVAPLCARAADASAIEIYGEGVQVYSCQMIGDDYAWTLKGPDAVLRDGIGRTVGRHFAGPSWEAQDGSIVVGEPLIASPAPQAGAVPWLVLKAKSHAGAGRFANVAYVVRSATQGGAAPATGCDAAHAQKESRQPYSATYTLFPQPEAAPPPTALAAPPVN